MPETGPRTLGYARVSTVGQTLAAQLDQLRVAGCRPIFQEKASGAKADRKQLATMLRGLQAGDVVTVTAIDRLARSVFDLFAIVKRIEDAGAVFRSLREPWADTTTATGRMMVAVMGGMADVEREIIYTRTQEGRARAKAAGVKLGRRPKLTPEQRRQVVAQLKDGAQKAATLPAPTGRAGRPSSAKRSGRVSDADPPGASPLLPHRLAAALGGDPLRAGARPVRRVRTAAYAGRAAPWRWATAEAVLFAAPCPLRPT